MSAPVAAPSAAPILSVLTRLALAIARRRAYGDVHPMVEQADAQLAEALARHVASEGTLWLAVAHRELLVDGQPAPFGAVSQDLATRLHQMNLGAVRFTPGVTREAITTFVRLVSRRAADVRPDEPLPDLPGIVLGRLDFDHLGLADEEAIEAETSQLWRSLADRVFAAVQADGTDNDLKESPATIGAALSQAAENADSARAAFEALKGMSEQVAMAPRRVREEIGERLQSLLSMTEQSAIVAALRAGDTVPRERLVSNVVDVLPAAAVVRWLNSAAMASGRDLSPHLLRLLTKMSVHFRGRRPEAVAEAVRDTARDLVEGWDLQEPNPEEHASLLETLAGWSARGGETASAAGDVFADPRAQEASRLVQMAIELDLVSEDAMLAVRRLADDGHATTVLTWIERGASAETAALLRDHTFTPTAILHVLLADPLDVSEVRHILEATPAESSGVLLEALERSESRTGRRLIYDRLRAMPASIVPAVCEHLARPIAWYFARNLLALLRDLLVAQPAAAEGLAVGQLLLYQRHEHEAVRREAVRVLVQLPVARTSALRRALDDQSTDVRQTAIDAAFASRTESWPADMAQRLLAIAGDESVDVPLREKAVRAVSGTVTTEVRTWLLAHASRKSTLLGSLKLAPVTPTVRAALHLLATRHHDAPDAAALIALARKAGAIGAGT